MREFCDFRVNEKFAHLVFDPGEGHLLSLSGVRKVVLESTDEKYALVGKVRNELKATAGKPCFFFGWVIIRKYSPSELASAQWFVGKINTAFEPTGKECGTLFDESNLCSHCGAGHVQTSDLWMNLLRIPKSKDIARSISDEWVVSQRFADMIAIEKLTGASLKPVHHRGRISSNPPAWYQLEVTSHAAHLSARTRVGTDPFDDDPENKFRCPLGHTLGLNRLSEAYLRPDSDLTHDMVCTSQLIGIREGLLRHAPVLILSKRFRQAFLDHGLKGLDFEVAHVEF